MAPKIDFAGVYIIYGNKDKINSKKPLTFYCICDKIAVPLRMGFFVMPIFSAVRKDKVYHHLRGRYTDR